MFDKLLIANRGEIACRVIRTAKRLGVRTVAVYSDADARAPHVELADQAVRIGPPPVRDSYLSMTAVLDAARATGAKAIHPGYGLLSEKAEFARAVAASGLVFVGPPPEVLDAFGDKIKARAVARAAGVEPPPGTPGPISPADTATLEAEAARIGLPLLVKAAGGGGGIGMQVVTDPTKLARAAQTCSDRGKSAFGDERVYLERFIASPKHIEVQIFCDAHGSGVALGERECSAQRRHQKVVEESPSHAPFFAGPEGEARRQKLHEDALRIVKSAGYVGAGTVEFVAGADGSIWFLEVNARLQVEHCVTEMVTGLDLVEHQLRVAAGERLAGELLAFAAGGAGRPNGHAIEARVYAEDPAKKFAPQPGRIAKLVWPEAGADLRVETGVREGSDVTPFYDPLLAKLVAWGADRAAASKRLDEALAATTLELLSPAGTAAATNLSFLRRILAAEAFTAGTYDTAFAEALAKG